MRTNGCRRCCIIPGVDVVAGGVYGRRNGVLFSDCAVLFGPGVGRLVIVVCGTPLRKLDRWYESDIVQEADYLNALYELLIITPIKVIGRVLWLTVDFIFIERTIINSVQNALKFMIFIFRRIHSGTLGGAILFILLGFAVIWWSWRYGG